METDICRDLLSVPIPKQEPLNPISAPSPPELPPLVKLVLKGFVVTLRKFRQLISHQCDDPLPVDVATRFQVHQALWLRSSRIEHRSCPPQNLADMRIVTLSTNPCNESSILV